MNILNKETAIQNERQLKPDKEIINDIIKIFSDNVLPISAAKHILQETLEELYKQPVIMIDENIKHIYRMRNTGQTN